MEVKWDVIKANLDMPWNWHWIMRNSNITLDIILENSEFNWDYKVLGYKANITIAYILANPDIPWNYGCEEMSNKVNDINIILATYDKPWNWDILTYNFDINDIIKHKYLPWNWDIVSSEVRNMSVVLENLYLPWNWQSLIQKFPDIVMHIEPEIALKLAINYNNKYFLKCDITPYYTKYISKNNNKINYLFRYIPISLITNCTEYTVDTLL